MSMPRVCRTRYNIKCVNKEATGSGLQPLGLDYDNLPPEGTNAIDKASTPRLGPVDQPGRRTASAVFSPMGGLSPAGASLLLLRTGDVETNSGPHCYTCGNPVRHDTSPLRCSTNNCSTVSHKVFTCSDLHCSNRWHCTLHVGPGPPS